MKQLLSLLVLGVFVASLTACDNQGTAPITTSDVGEQVPQATSGGMDMGDAALGAVGGMLIGGMLNGGSDRRQTNNNTTIIKQKNNVYSPRPYRSLSSRSFSGGRR